MKRALIFTLALAAGCSSIPESDPDLAKPKPETPATPPPNPKEVELRQLRTQLATKKADLSQANADLDRLAVEREQLDAADASAAKTARLTEIAALETEAKRKKQVLPLDIAEMEARVRDLTAGSKEPDDLVAALEADAAAEREKAETRKAKEDADRQEQGKRIAAAEAAVRAEAEAKSKEKVAGGRPAGEGDAAIFEERWADVIIKVRETLQQYKRW